MLKGVDPLAFVDSAELDPESRLLDMSENGDEWLVDDSTVAEYSELAGISDVVAGGLGRLIIENIGQRQGNVGVDIAGGTNGKALQGLLSSRILDKALVTNFTDSRNDLTRADERLGHVAGDLFERSTWEAIDSWVGENAPGGLSLIMHRPVGVGPLQEQPIEFYEGALDFLLERTKEGGLLFFQVPERLVIPSPRQSLKPISDRLINDGLVEVLFSSIDPNSDFPQVPAHVLLKKA